MSDAATGWILVALLLLIIGALAWIEIQAWRDLRARQRATAEAWSAWCDEIREGWDRLEQGRDPGPVPKWREQARRDR